MYDDHHVWDQINNICLTYNDTNPALKTTDIKKKAAGYLHMDKKDRITKSDLRRIYAKAKKIKKHTEKLQKFKENILAKRVIQVYNG
jgi:hypothetical protein